MHAPPRRCGRSKRAHFLSQNERGQNIPYPVHQIWPDASGLVVFNEAFQPSVTNGTDNHLLIAYGKAVRIASSFFRVPPPQKGSLKIRFSKGPFSGLFRVSDFLSNRVYSICSSLMKTIE